MHRFWDIVSAPLLDLVGAQDVIEIGAASGDHTRRLSGWARERGARLRSIDPEPRFDVSTLEDPDHGIVIDTRPSLDALAEHPACDVAFVDGDHNWYTVRNEVALLDAAARAAGRPSPILVCHDVCWPYGRRDLYYVPDRIPAEHRQPWRRAGIVEGISALSDAGGLNAHLCNAEHEGGPRNGVLTGIEDAVADFAEPADILVLPVLYGLALVVPRARVRAHPGLAEWLARWDAAEGLRDLALLADRHRRSSDVILQAASAAPEPEPEPVGAVQRVEEVRGRSFRPALPPDALAAIQAGVLVTRYRGVALYKDPFSLALYQGVLGELRPGTIIEIGAKHGGSALWFADQMAAQGLTPRVLSLDIEAPPELSDPRITFVQGDALALGEVLTAEVLDALPRPWIVVEDSAHTQDTTTAALEFFDAYLAPGDLIVVEDGVLADLPDPFYARYEDGPNRAVEAFLTTHGDRYEIDADLCDRYGHNVTWAPNGWLRRR